MLINVIFKKNTDAHEKIEREKRISGEERAQIGLELSSKSVSKLHIENSAENILNLNSESCNLFLPEDYKIF